MKICFINPPNQFGRAPLPHMGLAYIAGMLMDSYEDVSTEIIDCPYQQIDSVHLRNELERQEYDIVGITTYFYNFSEVFKLVRYLKKLKKQPFVVLGGYYPTLHPQKTFHIPGVDCICIGEGEYFFKELVYAIKNNLSWKEISGVAYLNEEDIVVQVSPNKLIEELDILPFPYIVKEPMYWFPVVSGRGCHGHCTFCSIVDYYKKVPGKKIRKRCPESVVYELKTITSKHTNKIIWMMDDNFFSVLQFDIDWIDKFVHLMEKEDVNCRFKIFVRSDELDKKILMKLKSVGLWGVVVGIESMVDRQLKLYGKNVTPQMNKEALDIVEELELYMDMGFILLDPFTTINELRTNLLFLKDSKFIRVAEPGHEIISSLGPLIVLEDTPIQRYLKDKDILSGSDVGYNFQSEEILTFYIYLQKWNKIVSPKYFEFNQSKMFIYYNNYGKLEEEYVEIYKECLGIDIDYMWELFHEVIKEDVNETNLDHLIEKYSIIFFRTLEKADKEEKV